ncbi:MAG: YceI family protein [bacterium]
MKTITHYFRRSLMFLAILGLLFAGSVHASSVSDSLVKFSFDQEKSDMKITGSSTVHDWTCDDIEKDGFIGVPESAIVQDQLTLSSLQKALQNNQSETPVTHLTVPVKKMHCEKSGMDPKMYKALKAKKHPTIEYKLNHVDVQSNKNSKKSSKKSPLTISTKGSLTIAGVQRNISMPLSVTISGDSTITVSGKKGLKMSSYNIEKPTAMWGTIQAYDDVTVHFQMVARTSHSSNGGQ